ncbi:MAG: hypothetical protein HY067_02600 [Betaproteobacteria bacterium]|nr:hypothetical protein [Betaproteobacteria bacterium]
MKPTSPEDRELEKMSSEVSERYRAGAEDEPSARLDAAVLADARREVESSRQRRNWQMPASIAAMLVIGVSLVLLVRDNEPPLTSLDRPTADEAKLAKSAPPQLAMKTQPKARADYHREDRPSRERSTRPDREPLARDELVAAQENAASGTAAPPAPVPAAPVVAGRAKSAEQEQSRIAESGDFSSSKKAKALADAATESSPSAQALRKEDAAAPAQPRDWLGKIDDLLRDGKEAEARRQLLGFRQQYPHYPLPERLQALLPPDQR